MKTFINIVVVFVFAVTFLSPLVIDWYMDKKDKEL